MPFGPSARHFSPPRRAFLPRNLALHSQPCRSSVCDGILAPYTKPRRGALSEIGIWGLPQARRVVGGDNYLTKPFEGPELLARLEALLRRIPPPSPAKLPDTFRFGPVLVDFRSTEVRRHRKPVEMSAREFQLLCYFIQHRGITIARQRLLKDVWGYDAEIFTRTVDVHVALLRQKLEEDVKDPRHFLTVRGLGYKFVDQAE